jgi:hypothetical protein
MMHYTELHAQLKSAGFNAGIFDAESVSPRIYLNGYGEKTKVYLFVDPARRQNNFCNPISGYGLHVGMDIIAGAKEKMLKRCKLKHQVMTELYEKGFALKPVTEFKVIGL